jgi:hypothetical protein
MHPQTVSVNHTTPKSSDNLHRVRSYDPRRPLPQAFDGLPSPNINAQEASKLFKLAHFPPSSSNFPQCPTSAMQFWNLPPPHTRDHLSTTFSHDVWKRDLLPRRRKEEQFQYEHSDGDDDEDEWEQAEAQWYPTSTIIINTDHNPKNPATQSQNRNQPYHNSERPMISSQGGILGTISSDLDKLRVKGEQTRPQGDGLMDSETRMTFWRALVW